MVERAARIFHGIYQSQFEFNTQTQMNLIEIDIASQSTNATAKVVDISNEKTIVREAV